MRARDRDARKYAGETSEGRGRRRASPGTGGAERERETENESLGVIRAEAPRGRVGNCENWKRVGDLLRKIWDAAKARQKARDLLTAEVAARQC